jgi:hypothetical protein
MESIIPTLFNVHEYLSKDNIRDVYIGLSSEYSDIVNMDEYTEIIQKITNDFNAEFIFHSMISAKRCFICPKNVDGTPPFKHYKYSTYLMESNKTNVKPRLPAIIN